MAQLIPEPEQNWGVMGRGARLDWTNGSLLLYSLVVLRVGWRRSVCVHHLIHMLPFSLITASHCFRWFLYERKPLHAVIWVSFTGQWSQVNRGLSCSLSITSVTYTDPSLSSPDSREMSGSNGREGICGSQTLWLTPIFFGAILEVLIWFSILGTQ